MGEFQQGRATCTDKGEHKEERNTRKRRSLMWEDSAEIRISGTHFASGASIMIGQQMMHDK